MKDLLFKRKGRFFLYFIACFFPVVSDLLQTYIFSKLFDAIAKLDPKYFFQVSLMAGAYVIIGALLYITSRLLRISYMRDTILDVRIAAFSKIMAYSYQQFSQKSKDTYLSNLINDINNFENNFFINLLNFIFRIGMYLGSLIIMLIIDYRLASAMVVFSFITFFLIRAFEKKTVALQKQVSKTNEDFTLNIGNTFNGLEILKLNNMDHKFLAKSFEAINKVEQSKYRFRFFGDSQRNLTQGIAGASTVAVLLYLIYQTKFGLQYDQLMMLLMLSGNMVFALPDIFPRLNIIKSSKEIYDKITATETHTNPNNRPHDFKFQKELKVSNLSFAYDDKDLFHNVSFTIEKGKKYLLKGASGVGKSTLIKLLSQTYPNYEGSISLDGIDLKTIKDKSFASKVAYIYQEVFLFEDSIKNNITLFKELDQKTIDEAIIKSGLQEFIQSRKQGLNEKLSENGKNLSGGERQRLSIARAIAKKAEILFVDEGTSAVNEELGKAIEQTFLNLDNTVIAISHRFYPGVTNQYDYVLEIKEGKIRTFTGKDYFAEEAAYV
ncbi:MAG TPA: ABC transporter ATP-binding protein [Bacilli bacterium]|nr:MAG: Lipid A export ATP-binding/permease protein MsbA [Tenericutes bacterium ADurb.BinA124]HPX84484.1 ABC transporter ATP-binding protein [Bacilli bacterium]HQC74360.1 ABC transporter ATP-binding protein [Bacilli bacterium]